jgi:hypothetical protein
MRRGVCRKIVCTRAYCTLYCNCGQPNYTILLSRVSLLSPADWKEMTKMPRVPLHRILSSSIFPMTLTSYDVGGSVLYGIWTMCRKSEF